MSSYDVSRDKYIPEKEIEFYFQTKKFTDSYQSFYICVGSDTFSDSLFVQKVR